MGYGSPPSPSKLIMPLPRIFFYYSLTSRERGIFGYSSHSHFKLQVNLLALNKHQRLCKYRLPIPQFYGSHCIVIIWGNYRSVMFVKFVILIISRCSISRTTVQMSVPVQVRSRHQALPEGGEGELRPGEPLLLQQGPTRLPAPGEPTSRVLLTTAILLRDTFFVK